MNASVAFPKLPPEFRRAVAKPYCGCRGCMHHPAHQKSTQRLARDSSARQSALVRPHRVYTIDTRDLLRRNPLAAAKPAGWQSLDLTDDGELASRTVALHPETKRPAVVSLDTGWVAKEVAAAFARVETHGLAHRLEFRFLMLAPIHTAGIWLHGRREDFIVPLPPCGVPLTPGQLYPAKQFFAAASGIAEHMLAAAKAWRRTEKAEAIANPRPTGRRKRLKL